MLIKDLMDKYKGMNIDWSLPTMPTKIIPDRWFQEQNLQNLQHPGLVIPVYTPEQLRIVYGLDTILPVTPPTPQPNPEPKQPAVEPEGENPDQLLQYENLTFMELQDKSLTWAGHIANHAVVLDKLLRVADGFVTENIAIFAEHSENGLAKAFQSMSQVVVDARKAVRDIAAFSKQIKDQLGDAHEYLGMVENPSAPTSDDKEIIEMALTTIKTNLRVSGEKIVQIRALFKKVGDDLQEFGAHLESMVNNTTKNLIEPSAKLQTEIQEMKTEVDKFKEEDEDCGVKFIQKMLLKKSNCQMIEAEMLRKQEQLDAVIVKQKVFAATLSKLQELKGLRNFLEDHQHPTFEKYITAKLTGFKSSMLPESDKLNEALEKIIAHSKKVNADADEVVTKLDTLFTEVVGRNRFAKKLQNLFTVASLV